MLNIKNAYIYNSSFEELLKELKEMWLFCYLDFEYWVWMLHNIAACISQFAWREWKNPIEFINLIV